MLNTDFGNLRLELDEAITYEGGDTARQIAQDALTTACIEKNWGEMLYFYAQLAMLDEDYDQAEWSLSKAIEVNPHDGAAYNDLGLCRVEAGCLDDALVLFDQGIAVEPDFATIHHNKGWLLNKMGHYQKAIICLQDALRLEPNRAVTYENLADTYANLDQVPQAIEACQRAMDLLKPGCIDIRQQLQERLDEFHRSRRRQD
jgi:tetratricopeptide (TPR) repeat protein